MHLELDREGDINNSKLRDDWLEKLDSKTKALLLQDQEVFLKQSMSTPCLNGIANAEGCYITDLNGKRYLDFHGNSLHQIGYKNPYVIEAVNRQMYELPFVPRRFTSDMVVETAELLIDQTISKDYRLLFTPSGSAAVGMALKIVRKVTGKHKIISMWESFHGAGLDTISVGGEYVFKKDMGPMMPGAIKAIPYNGYRNLLGSKDEQAISDFCLDYIEYIIRNEGEIGAILLEPVRATDTHIPPKTYFQRLRKICDTYEIMLIFDEIPTGIGRSGKFFVHENFYIEPDILVLGKGLGGGIIPQAAVLINKRFDVANDISLGHYTHEKPALGCAAVKATIDYIKDHNLINRCSELSIYARRLGDELLLKHDVIGDFRIIGLLMTFEFDDNKDSKEKDNDLVEKILYHCLEKGLSFKISSGNCITWHPPLIVTKKELSFAFSLLDEAINDNI